jgi:putative DNA primase/helicase
MKFDTELEDIPEVSENPQIQDLGTDLDASLRFVAAAESKLRYCPAIGWLAWDEKRWSVSGDAAAMELSKSVARDWVLHWMDLIPSDPDNQQLKKNLKMALALEGGPRLRSVVELAKTDPKLCIEASGLDRDQWLLNVQNGTLDLKTGHLRPHCREDFITKLAPVNYRPDATHPMLEKYLQRVRETSPDMPDFLARCFGAALTGDASTESLFLLQGEGASGKTTLVEAIALMLGEYTAKLQFESFCASKHGRSPGAASPDLITLRGARLAYASEGSQSARLDAGLIKLLTGKEELTARALYKAPVRFEQTWKLWLVSNFDPNTESDDTGIWRRILKLHFEVVPPEKRNPEIKTSLATDPMARSALLSWCLKGCLDWQARGGGREGLAAPECVLAVTDEYRAKQDILGEWWKALLVDATLGEHEVAFGSMLRGHYENWAREFGTTPVQGKRFREFLIRQGLKEYRDANNRGWKGIKLDSYVHHPAGSGGSAIIRPSVNLPEERSYPPFSRLLKPDSEGEARE